MDLSDFRDVLEPFLGSDLPWETSVHFAAIARQGAPATLALVMGGGYGRLGYFHPDEGIVLHKRELDTAAGIALVAHEANHAREAQYIPDFLEQYEAEERRRLAVGLPPYANLFEYPCYVLECQVWHSLVNQGVEPGPWLPLGVEAGLC